jgi:hypothetical protein
MSIRDKWLAAVLPALVTLLAGWIFFLRPASRELAGLRQRVENQGPLSARQTLLLSARTERLNLEKMIAIKRAAAAGEAGAFDRNGAMQQVSRLCAAHNLSLNAAAPEPGGKLPRALQEAAAALSRMEDGVPPQVWRIELDGSYPGVVRLLEALGKTKPLIVPLNLSMEAGKNERNPAKWTISLWL